jgi:hypothetical protein
MSEAKESGSSENLASGGWRRGSVFEQNLRSLSGLKNSPKVAKEDLLITKNNLVAGDAEPTGNEDAGGYAIQQRLAIETNDGL